MGAGAVPGGSCTKKIGTRVRQGAATAMCVRLLLAGMGSAIDVAWFRGADSKPLPSCACALEREEEERCRGFDLDDGDGAANGPGWQHPQ
nr:unnamed protein product [Digitaria exilis]